MDKLKLYEELKEEILSCRGCDLGCETLEGYDPHVVGQGNLNAEIMFVAEAPGKNETIHARPMTPPGVTGVRYEKILASLGLARDDVYTTNTVACRPPGNRDPEPWELKRCRQYLDRQIALVNPKLIVTFGRFASQVFVNNIKITKDHGQVYKCASSDVDVYPVYHPSYVHAYASQIRRAEFKKDIEKLKRIVDQL